MSPARSLARLGSVLALLLVGCQPTFRSEGSLSVMGQAFQPVSCRILIGATGLELADAQGRRVELTLPPATLYAWRDLSGTPRARLGTGGAPPARDLGPCGTLTMSGEGYHSGGRRAASGEMSLSCGGSGGVSGQLRFSGCF